MASREILEAVDLGLPVGAAWTRSRASRQHVGAPISLSELEREHIAQVVAHSSSLEAAARVLDIDATTLQRKRKRAGWCEPAMIPGRLRIRFIVAAGLLVVTTVVASVWTLVSLAPERCRHRHCAAKRGSHGGDVELAGALGRGGRCRAAGAGR